MSPLEGILIPTDDMAHNTKSCRNGTELRQEMYLKQYGFKNTMENVVHISGKINGRIGQVREDPAAFTQRTCGTCFRLVNPTPSYTM
jgi:hypothetical protein